MIYFPICTTSHHVYLFSYPFSYQHGLLVTIFDTYAYVLPFEPSFLLT